MLRQTAARGWGKAKTASARKGNQSFGVALGSGYQAYFAAMSSSGKSAEIARMQSAGISWVRMDAEWWTVQPTSTGGFNWSVPDATATPMIAGGMNIVVLLNESPAWARRTANTAPLYSPWKTPDPALYAAYCAAAATHYSAMGVHVYELWNEPNLDTGATTAAGWGHKSPLGLAELSIAAYPAIKAADPNAFILSGSLATASEFGTAGTVRSGASWGAVNAGDTSATVSCSAAVASDAYGILTDTADGWPVGTVISAAVTGTGWTLKPPAWTASFPAVPAQSAKTVRVSNVQYPPDVFLAQAYAFANGKPMFDALAIHPYTQPVLPSAQLAIYGGWATVPTLRSIMVANGDAGKTMWITEYGAPTGVAVANWSSALSTASSLTVTCSTASAADVSYWVTGTNMPAGAFVDTANAGASWTVRPPTGLTLSTALTSGAATSTVTVAATASPVTIASGTPLRVVVASGSTGTTTIFSVTTSSSVTTSTSAATSIPVTSATPGYAYPVGSPVLGSVGQTWGSAVSAGSSVAVTLLAPGVAAAFGAVDEATQSAMIAQAVKSIAVGLPAVGGPGSAPWPFAGPLFIYTWNDSGGGAGPFGLTRVDGTAKTALSTLTAIGSVKPNG